MLKRLPTESIFTCHNEIRHSGGWRGTSSKEKKNSLKNWCVVSTYLFQVPLMLTQSLPTEQGQCLLL